MINRSLEQLLSPVRTFLTVKNSFVKIKFTICREFKMPKVFIIQVLHFTLQSKFGAIVRTASSGKSF
jgi:hypothetical protein